MTFACTGWGSLCWDPRELPVGEWRKDGPVLPLEFARQSQDRRITLVLTEKGTELQTLWAELSASSLDEAANLLRDREGCHARHIGRSDATFPYGERVQAWATARGLSGVVWTALPPKWNEENGRSPSLAELKTYLRELPADARSRAMEYIEKAPAQIATRYRAELWAAITSGG
jgi:hypothetical protein